MIQGGATYAGFTYVLERFFSSPSTKQQNHKELAYTDVPLNRYISKRENCMYVCTEE